MRRIGVLMSAASETDQQAGLAVFKEILHQLDWIDGRNMRLEIRWARGDSAEARRDAEELVALPADVIMVTGGARAGSADANDALGADRIQQCH